MRDAIGHPRGRVTKARSTVNEPFPKGEGMGDRPAKMMSGGWLMCLVVVLLASSLPASSVAQTVSVGMRGGLNATGVLYQDASSIGNTLPRVGGHAGVAAALAPSRFLELEGALLYSQGGFQGRGGHPAHLKTDDLVLHVKQWPHVQADTTAFYHGGIVAARVMGFGAASYLLGLRGLVGLLDSAAP